MDACAAAKRRQDRLFGFWFFKVKDISPLKLGNLSETGLRQLDDFWGAERPKC